MTLRQTLLRVDTEVLDPFQTGVGGALSSERQGYLGYRVNDISSAASVAHTFYIYFTSKEGSVRLRGRQRHASAVFRKDRQPNQVPRGDAASLIGMLPGGFFRKISADCGDAADLSRRPR
jgi:hypothetical protein